MALLNLWRTVDVRAEVNLADVVVLQHGGVSGVGSVVSGAVIEGAASGEGQAGVESVFLDQLTRAILQPLTEQDGGRDKGRWWQRLVYLGGHWWRFKNGEEESSHWVGICQSAHQISIMVFPGCMKLRTCWRTCLCASAACRKSFHISSLALSRARLSSGPIRHTALRL